MARGWRIPRSPWRLRRRKSSSLQRKLRKSRPGPTRDKLEAELRAASRSGRRRRRASFWKKQALRAGRRWRPNSSLPNKAPCLQKRRTVPCWPAGQIPPGKVLSSPRKPPRGRSRLFKLKRSRMLRWLIRALAVPITATSCSREITLQIDGKPVALSAVSADFYPKRHASAVDGF